MDDHATDTAIRTLRLFVVGRVGDESGASTSDVSWSWISLRRARRLFDSGMVDLFLSVGVRNPESRQTQRKAVGYRVEESAVVYVVFATVNTLTSASDKRWMFSKQKQRRQSGGKKSFENSTRPESRTARRQILG